MSLDEPHRNEEQGKWNFNYPYVNSLAYKKIKSIVNEYKISWENDPECFIITI